MAVISKGIRLTWKKMDTFIRLDNLMEIPDIGAETDSIEITTLADDAHMYTNGIKNYGESLSFKFLYDTV